MKIQDSENFRVQDLVQGVCRDERTTHPIRLANSQKVKAFVDTLKGEDTGLIAALYGMGEEIVTRGVITDEILRLNPELGYASVPLGFIIRGNITVIKDGKGTKTLGEGDFLGLFETGISLVTGKRRQVGDWNLTASSDAEVLYFGSSVLNKDTVAAQAFRDYVVGLARADRVPQPLSESLLLDWVASHTTKARPKDCAVVIHTHLLPNSQPFFRHIASLVDFGRIYVLDKPYSTVRSVLNQLVLAGFEVVPVKMDAGLPYEFATEKSLDVLWGKVIDDQKKRNFKKLLIVDDGGEVWRSVPWNELEDVSIAAVEQTQRGIARAERDKLRFPPTVSVASSGVKKHVESEFIGISIVKKLDELGVLARAKQVGIVGMGSIGLAVDNSLRERGLTPFSYDPKYHMEPPTSPEARSSMDVLLNDCDLIIGTTGTDALKGLPYERVMTGKKILASASSADIEFSSLLKMAAPHSDPFGTVVVPLHEKLTVEILNGGYPINFDRENNATPDDDIVLTWCLMYIGAMQALELLDKGGQESAVYNLDKLAQAKVFERWIDEKNKTTYKTHFTKDEVADIVASVSFKGAKDAPSVWED
jgi:hypothetical protein